jgi:glycosyltransferase involved in cell wall biosynthesis
MKLLLLIHSLGSGGAERVLSTLANHWANKEWQVTVVTMTSEATDFYQLDNRIRRIALNLARDSTNSVVAVINNLHRVLAVRRLLHKIQPDVALAMMSTSNIVLALASLGIRNIVTVGSERTHPPNAFTQNFWNRARRLSYRYLSAVVTLTQESAGWLIANASPKKVAVIPNAAIWPLPPQTPIIKPPPNSNGYRLITVGRLSHEKGFDLLIQAFSKLASDFPDWELVIIGEGPERVQRQAQIDMLGLTRQIKLPGRCGNLQQWYESGDLYVLTSRFEGFPNTVVEAMSHGLPVVSFDCTTGPREIIRPGIDGVLVAPEDRKELEVALRDLMTDHDKRRQFGQHAIEVRSRFALERVVDLWEALFNDLRSTSKKA